MDQSLQGPPGAAPPDWRGLCEELVLSWDADGCDWKPQHQARWNATVDRARAALAQPEPEVVGPTDGEPPPGPFSEHDLRQQWNQQADEFNQWDSLDSSEQLAWAQVRAIAADRARRPAPAPVGEVGELVADLRDAAFDLNGSNPAKWMLTRAADLLERQAAPVPVASDIRYEFSVYDEDYTEQAGGTAPSYAQALSMGQRYLTHYQQDGPHTLELRRVEALTTTEAQP